MRKSDVLNQRTTYFLTERVMLPIHNICQWSHAASLQCLPASVAWFMPPLKVFISTPFRGQAPGLHCFCQLIAPNDTALFWNSLYWTVSTGPIAALRWTRWGISTCAYSKSNLSPLSWREVTLTAPDKAAQFPGVHLWTSHRRPPNPPPQPRQMKAEVV